MANQPVKYLQTDKRWANMDYSANGESTTIGKAGCGTTCAAMLIAELADPSVTPITTTNWSKAHGYKALRQGTYYSYFTPQFAVYGIECEQISWTDIYHNNNKDAQIVQEKIKNYLWNGDYVIAVMGKGNKLLKITYKYVLDFISFK